MRVITIIVLCAAFVGCTANYKQKTYATPNSRLATGASVIIATPADGYFGDIKYPDSGMMTAQAISKAFTRHTEAITVSTNCGNLACLKQLNDIHAYYVVPEILHWEERATEWSGKPDRIEVKIDLYEYQTWNQMSSAVIAGKSKWATFGGDHPQDLLHEPLQTHIDSLY